MVKKRTKIPKNIENEVLRLSNNRCCICQTPFIQFHHIDSDPSNNAIGNIAPLCPNCHSQTHSSAKMTVNLSPKKIIALRDKWYDYCRARKDGSNISGNALLKLHIFIRSLGLADHSWKKTFSVIDPVYEKMTREEIINRIFSTSNRDDLMTGLDTIKSMYTSQFVYEKIIKKFRNVCYAFGIDYDDL